VSTFLICSNGGKEIPRKIPVVLSGRGLADRREERRNAALTNLIGIKVNNSIKT
jgi:hypothetical protein